MKNYVVEKRNDGVSLACTPIGCWSQSKEGELYLTLDDGYACFISDCMVVTVEGLPKDAVYPLPPGSKITFTQIDWAHNAPLKMRKLSPAIKKLARDNPAPDPQRATVTFPTMDEWREYCRRNGPIK